MSNLQDYLALDERALYSQLGAYVVPVLGIQRAAEDDEREGRKWFSQNLPRLRELTCSNNSIKSALAASDPNSDSLLIISALVDIFVDKLGFPAAATVSVLIIRYGIAKLCVD